MKSGIWKEKFKKAGVWSRKFYPPLVLSLLGAIIFSALSMVNLATDFFGAFPTVLQDIVYTCAAVFLVLFIWSLIILLRQRSLKQLFYQTAEKNPLSAKLVSDFSYRTMIIACFSLFLNIIMTAFKMMTGWYYASIWLMALSGYYMILIISKLVFIGYGRRKSKLTDANKILIHEWKAYRVCGILLLALTAFLQGVVILIVRDGQGFAYHEIVVIAIAAYDFYCLGNSIFYMIVKRKKHSPIVNSMKSMSLASSLVAILSLQTAMFSSFGGESQILLRKIMNLATGTAVCLFLIILGITMLVRANKELKQIISRGKDHDKYIGRGR